MYDSAEFNPLEYVSDFVPSLEDSEAPVFFCDLSDIVCKWRKWNEQLPRVKPHYAVKSNSDQIVLKVLEKLGTGFDCASKEEIESVIKMGVNPRRIVYAHTVKFVPHIKYAQKVNVDLMTFDRLSELEKIAQFYPSARLMLRIRFDSKESVWCAGEKFGCDPILEAPLLIKSAKAMGMNIVGIHFHIGSNGTNPTIYGGAIETASRLFDLAKSVGFDMKFLDMGGGYPIRRGQYLEPYARVINKALDQHFPETRNVTIMTEPGQYFSGSSCTLFTTVQAVRETNLDGFIKMDYFLNDGNYSSMRFVQDLNKVVEINGFKRSQKNKEIVAKQYNTALFGPTCSGDDIILRNIKLPKLDTGDLVYLRNMGAYTICTNSNFNGFRGAVVKYFMQRQDFDMIFGINL